MNALRRPIGCVLAVAIACCLASGMPARTQPVERDRARFIYDTLIRQTRDPRGFMFGFSGGNTLPDDWIIQTNERDGGLTYLKAVRDLMLTARSRIDITTLGAIPKTHTAFRVMFKEVIKKLNDEGHRVTVRFLFGRPSIPGMGDWDIRDFTDEMSDAVRRSAKPTVDVYAATMETKTLVSWNHAKIVAVDGKSVIIGGHNFYADDYVTSTPIFDLSMRVDGPAAVAAERFSSALWLYACTYARPYVAGGTWTTTAAAYLHAANAVQDICLPFAPAALPPEGGPVLIPPKVNVLGVAHAGIDMMSPNIDPIGDRWLGSNQTEQWGDLARNSALGMAQKSIRISQQALLFPLFAPYYSSDSLTKALAEALMRNVHVYIVVSTPDGKSYASPAPMRQNVEAIFRFMRGKPGARERACTYLHVTTVARRVNPHTVSRYWPNGAAIGNHAKFFMVDDRLFSIGSQNFYPPTAFDAGAHQEYSFLIDSPTHGQQLLKTYWNPLWDASRVGAFIGGDTPCPIDRNGNIPFPTH